jgi:hypothetical protein
MDSTARLDAYFHTAIISTVVADAMGEFCLVATGAGGKPDRGNGVVGAAGAFFLL